MADSYGNDQKLGGPLSEPSSFNENDQAKYSFAPLPLLHNPGISLIWTDEEQTILEEFLLKYSSESHLSSYLKIASLLKDKTVRDIALRHRWMTEEGKRKKEDHNLTKKSKDKKGKGTDRSVRSSGLAGGPSHYAEGMGIRDNILYKGAGGATAQLLRQNAQMLEQISANFGAYQMQSNIGLFCQARDNMHKIMNSFSDTQDIMKKMPPLPVKLNEELARLILPPTTLESVTHDQVNNFHGFP